MSDVARVGLFAHRWAAAAPTGVGRHAHGLAAGLAEVLHGSPSTGATRPGPATEGGERHGVGATPGPRAARPGVDSGGRAWAITATSAAEADAGARLPAGIGWRPLPGPRKLRLAAWRLLGRPAIDGPLGGPGLVHSVLPFVPVPTRARFVQTVPDTLPLQHPEWHGWFERWGFTGGFGVLREADAVVVSSAHVGREVVDHLGIAPDRVAVVPLGVDPAFGADLEPGAVEAVVGRHGVVPGRYVVAVGAVTARKNVTVLLDALAALGPTGGVELLLVGPIHDDVAAAIAARGLAARARTTGFVPDVDLHGLLRGAAALVHPSTAEGFGLTPLEAMAAGVPAIVAGTTALPEVVGDAGVVVAPDDPAAWATAIERVRGDAAWAGALAAAGRARAARFTWRATAEGHLAVWAAVLDGRPLPSSLRGG